MSITTVGSLSARAVGHRAEERELRLFVAAEHACVQAVVLAHARGELRAVGGVAHGRGEHGDVGLAVVGVDRGAVVVERAQHALDGLLGERAVRVDAVSQPGDLRAAHEFLDRAVGGSTSAISRRVELVPMSTTATRTRGNARRVGVHEREGME